MAKDIRSTLHSVYTFVRGVESNRSIASITLDHLLQEQIDSIIGGEARSLVRAEDETSRRPSKLEVLERIQNDIDAIVAAVESAGEDPSMLADLGIVVESEEG